MNASEGLVVVLGRGKDGKNRAAVFDYQDAEVAKRAVSVTGLKIGRAETKEAIALAKLLPTAKMFASSKGPLPLVRRDLLDKLLKVIELVEVPASTSSDDGQANDASPSIEEDQTAGAKTGLAFESPWNLIVVGSSVLHCADPKEGWYPCKVVGVSADGKKLTLVWRDYSKFTPFEVKRIAVGLLAKVH